MPELLARYEEVGLTKRWVGGWCALCLALVIGLWLGHSGKEWSMPVVGMVWFAGWYGMDWATSLPVRVLADREGLVLEARRGVSVYRTVGGRLAWGELTWFAVAPSSATKGGVAQSEISVGTGTRRFLLVGELQEVQRFFVRAEELRTGIQWQGPPRRSE